MNTTEIKPGAIFSFRKHLYSTALYKIIEVNKIQQEEYGMGLFSIQPFGAEWNSPDHYDVRNDGLATSSGIMLFPFNSELAINGEIVENTGKLQILNFFK